MITEEIRQSLFELQDIKYRDFRVKLIPGKDTETMIGVRTPELRKLAKQMLKREDIGEFLRDLPHRYFDEDQLHAFVISLEKDFGKCVAEVDAFLPFVDNWATCDQLSPKAFQKEPEKLLPHIHAWLRSGKTYTVRFAIGMLMQHFLGENFDISYADSVASVRSEEYYVNMMIAWYFATALAKQYDLILPYLEEKRLEDWVHNKAIQKSVESCRITEEQKAYLKTLKVRRSR